MMDRSSRTTDRIIKAMDRSSRTTDRIIKAMDRDSEAKERIKKATKKITLRKSSVGGTFWGDIYIVVS